MTTHRYRTIDELQDLVRQATAIRTVCEYRQPYELPAQAFPDQVNQPEANRAICQITGDPTVLAAECEISAPDFVATFPARTQFRRIQQALGSLDLALPYLPIDDTHEAQSLGEVIGLGLPHRLEGKFGSWRDWILGMTMVLADGTAVKTGSKVTKSVAGFDVHKLLVGARGTLAIPAAVTLRVWPRVSVEQATAAEAPSPEWNLIHRVLPSDFAEAKRAHGQETVKGEDSQTSTLFLRIEADELSAIPRFIGDWTLGRGFGAANLEIPDPGARHLLARAGAVFDPGRKLNAGALGVI